MGKAVKAIIGSILLLMSLSGLTQLVTDVNLRTGSGASRLGYIVGYLTPTILFLGIGIYLIYSVAKPDQTVKEESQIDEEKK